MGYSSCNEFQKRNSSHSIAPKRARKVLQTRVTAIMHSKTQPATMLVPSPKQPFELPPFAQHNKVAYMLAS